MLFFVLLRKQVPLSLFSLVFWALLQKLCHPKSHALGWFLKLSQTRKVWSCLQKRIMGMIGKLFIKIVKLPQIENVLFTIVKKIIPVSSKEFHRVYILKEQTQWDTSVAASWCCVWHLGAVHVPESALWNCFCLKMAHKSSAPFLKLSFLGTQVFIICRRSRSLPQTGEPRTTNFEVECWQSWEVNSFLRSSPWSWQPQKPKLAKHNHISLLSC